MVDPLDPWIDLAYQLRTVEQVPHVELYQLFEYGCKRSEPSPYDSCLEYSITKLNEQYDVRITYEAQLKLPLIILPDGSQGSRFECYSSKKNTLIVAYFKNIQNKVHNHSSIVNQYRESSTKTTFEFISKLLGFLGLFFLVIYFN